MLYLGIDPGRSGGWGLLSDLGVILGSGPLSVDSPRELFDLFTGLVDFAGQSFPVEQLSALLERVHSLPSQGHVGAFTFGKNVGHVEMGLAAAGISYNHVSPLKWQNAMDARTGGDKRVSRARAIQLFPNHGKITHAIADALLIAEYHRRTRGAILPLSGGLNGKETETPRSTPRPSGAAPRR
jgi:hypothetical protein